MNDIEKREELRRRIEAGEQRNAERTAMDYARQARDSATEFVKEHPIATVAAGVAIGVLIAGFLPGPGRRARQAATRKTSAFASMLTDLGLAYGASLIDGLGDAAQAGRDRLDDLGDSLTDGAKDLRREAGHRAGGAADTARRLTRDVGKSTGRKVRDLRARMAH